MAEISFEQAALALETTPGTAVTPPTHLMAAGGTMEPAVEYITIRRATGTLAGLHSSTVVRDTSTWSIDGPLDIYLLKVLLNMVLRGGVTAPASQPAPLTYQWVWSRNMVSNTLRTATLFGGDPNTPLGGGTSTAHIMRAPYAIAKELTLTANVDSTDAVMMTASGVAGAVTPVTVPVFPALLISPVFLPQNQRVWLDTSSAIGTTEITGDIISSSMTFPSGLQEKHVAGGTEALLGYNSHGIGVVTPSASVQVELPDWQRLQLARSNTEARLRIRYNGPHIEGVYYWMVEADFYGQVAFGSWDEFAGVNRAMTLNIGGNYNATAATDVTVRIYSTRNVL